MTGLSCLKSKRVLATVDDEVWAQFCLVLYDEKQFFLKTTRIVQLNILSLFLAVIAL